MDKKVIKAALLGVGTVGGGVYKLAEQLKDVKVGEPCDVHAVLRPILGNAAIFGVDLYEAGLGAYTEDIFAELIAGKGAVRAALRKHLQEA